jgi:hypothetical protein
MANSRFTKLTYVRQLYELYDEIVAWRAEYRLAAERTDREWLQGRFLDREAVLGDVELQLRDVIDTLLALPRLS